MAILITLYRTSPQDWLQKLSRRIFRQDYHSLKLHDVLQSPKYMRSQRMFDFLNRYELILKRVADWQPLNFEGKNVLDLGGGPLLGWGPLAIFRGARRVVCVEPIVRPEFLTDRRIVERYFLPMFRDLSAIYGARFSSFEGFQKAIQEKIVVSTVDLLDNTIKGPIDIMLSNSCLEHIWSLDKVLKRMHELSSPGARFLHCVDFGNHRNTQNPFAGIYSNAPETYWKRYGRLINLVWPKEMLRIFEKAGFRTTLTPYYSSPEFYDEPICDYWQACCNPGDRFLKTALFTGTAA